jgi:GNAT superfamily N-acetyltransferase
MKTRKNELLSIRPANEADVNLLAEFIRGIAEYEKLADEVVADEAILRESFFGSRPSAEALIAEWDGKPVAFAVFFENFSTFMGRSGLYLEDLYVKPEYRCKGIGKALLSHLAGIAVERGCPRFEWVALDWNRNAIDFYEKLGAKKMHEWQIFRISGDKLEELAHASY